MPLSSKYTKFLKEISSTLKCTSCKGSSDRLYQCCNGHPYCPTCTEKCKICIICKNFVLMTNCTTLDKLLEILHSSNEEEVIEQIIRQLECCICYKRVDPPVKLCCFGHVVCSSCYRRIARCPICNSSYPQIRNKLINIFVTKFPFPCRYRNMGCVIVDKHAELQNHELKCKYREYLCHVQKCNWSGTKQNLIQHVSEKHNDIISSTSSGTVELKFVTTNDGNEEAMWETVKLVLFNRNIFWQHFRTVNTRVLCAVTIVGPSKDASEYKAVVEGKFWSETFNVLGEESEVEELFNRLYPQAKDITNLMTTVRICTEPEVVLVAECKISLIHSLTGKLTTLEMCSLTLIGGLVLYFCLARGLM